MLLFLRKLIFYLLCIFYLIMTPYAILYALGYIYNPVEGALVKTGLVSVVTSPRSANLFVEGKKFSQKTPAAVRDLLPGNYHLKITRKGYDTWEKTVSIHPEKATRLEPVILLPRKSSDEVISERPYSRIIPAVVDSKIFVWEGATLDTLWKIDLFFRRETPVGREIPGAGRIRILSSQFVEGSELVLLAVEEAGKKGFLALDLGREKRGVRKLDAWIQQAPFAWDWDPKDSEQIYFLEQGVLSRLDLRKGKLYPGLAGDLAGFGVRNHRLYFLKKNFSLFEANDRGENPEPLLHDPLLSQKIFSSDQGVFYRIEVFKKDLLQKDLFLFLSSRGALVSSRLPYHLVDEGVAGLQYAQHAPEERILFWTREKIGRVDFSRDAEGFFERGPSPVFLVTSRRNIRQAFWAFEDTHVVFVDGNQIFLAEAAEPAPYLVREIGRLATGTSMVYSEPQRALYYLDTSGRLLKKKLGD